ncbi:hypothetical protein ACHQM5_002084 [Ranunculus cassubicifolius]
MEIPVDFQKFCQIETRRLLILILMTSVASLVLVVQFLSIPYGTVLVSLFPSGEIPLIEKSNHSGAASFPKSEVILGLTSVSSNSSGPTSAMKNTAESDSVGNPNHLNDPEGMKGSEDYNSGQNEDVEPENEVSPEEIFDKNEKSQFGNVENSQNSTSEEAMELRNGSQSGKVSDDNVTLILEPAESKDSEALVPALQPVTSSSNVSLLGVVNANLSISVISDSNISAVPQQATSSPSKDNMNKTSNSILTNRSEMVTDRSNSNNDLTMKSNTLQKDDSQMHTGQASSKKLTKSTSSIQVETTPSAVTTILDMNLLLFKSHTSSHSMIPKWPSKRDQEILSARSLIENAPIIKQDKQLYGSVFRNVSMFKRSYELMEKTLKVYVYKEGAQPVFHRPETKGIYASEGWFMKLMEGNHHFTVTDPAKAHLFYFPFSTRRLEQFMYVPNSHSSRNLIAYLKSYLDVISTKYPYWNRTMGADHFLVGCHDWTPHETKQYMGKCIRAMCNADISYDFTMGKDVSLPETNIRLAKDPVRDLGGKPASKRKILAFFAGSINHGYVRPVLLKYWENKDPDMEIHGHMGRSGKKKNIYAEYMKNSKYCICAKGYEVNSPRVVEAIFYECVPVIISDNFVPPFFEVLNWESFAVFVAEKDIPNLKNILSSISQEKYLRLQMRVRQVQQHFLWHSKPVKYDIFHMILHSVWYNRVFQIKVA